MKNFQFTQLFVFILLLSTLSGCQAIGDIFEAGVWVGVVVVVLVIVFIFWIIKKLMS